MSASTAAAATPRKLRPGVAGYWVGGALVLLGIAGAVVWFVVGLVGLSNSVDDFERVPADGGGTVTLDSDTSYVIYVEDPPGASVRVRLTDPSGETVNVQTYGSEFDYDFGGRSGTALFTFRSRGAGDYALASESFSSSASIAVGSSLAGDLVWTIVMPFVIGGIGLLAGLVLVVVTLVRRNGDKRRRDASDAPAVATRPPPPPPGFPPPRYPPAPPRYPPAGSP